MGRLRRRHGARATRLGRFGYVGPRYTVMVKVPSKEADHVKEKIQQRLQPLGIQRYFADPGCPYPRGTHENTQGLIRQYFPLGTNFRNSSHQAVRRVENLLNDRPHTGLGFRMPAEVFFEKTAPARCN